MSILHKIQHSITDDQNNIAQILLKLRLLAAKLNSKELESWVQYESEGYSNNVDVPEYRKVPVFYKAHFARPFGAQISNAPIPSELIEKIAGEQWIKYRLRDSISSIESLISNSKNIACVGASDLIPLLQGKWFPDYTCISVSGLFSTSSLVGIQNFVRSRILELTIKLEKSIPAITSIDFVQNKDTNINNQQVSQIFNQTIQGDCTVIINSGHNTKINVSVGKGDKLSLISHLISHNFPKNEAKKFADIVASERPKSKDIPFGGKTSQWIRNKLPKISKACKMTYSTILNLVEKAVSNYYGL